VLPIAGGEYVAFLDSDDVWLPTKLEKQVKLLEKSEAGVGIVYTGCTWIDETGSVVKQVVPRYRGNILDELLASNCVTFSSVLVRKICFDDVGLFDEELLRSPDWDMWIRLARNYEFEFLQERLVRYLHHSDSLSRDIDAIIEARKRIHEKIADQLASKRRTHSLHHFNGGNLYCHRGAMEDGRKELLRALRLYPFRARYFIHLLASLGGYALYRRLGDMKRTLLATIP
jgi:glycosyltransferase involved in cell wall biosynthesis